MVCATFGHQALAPHAKGFSIFNGILTLLAGIFCILGCISNTNSEVGIFALPWVVLSTPPNALWAAGSALAAAVGDPVPVVGLVTTYISFGLRGFILYTLSGDGTALYAESASVLNFLNFLESQSYSGPTCPAPLYAGVVTFAQCSNTACVPAGKLLSAFCAKCQTSGQGVIATLVISLLLAFASFAGFLFRCCCDGTFWKDITVFGSIAAFGFGVAAYSIAGPCKSAIETWAIKELDPGNYVSGYGKGAGLVAAGWSMLLIVSLIALMVPVPQPPKETKDKSAGLANKK